jgi:UDP-N-acetylglucosamine 1-carboxyvinyltransferase
VVLREARPVEMVFRGLTFMITSSRTETATPDGPDARQNDAVIFAAERAATAAAHDEDATESDQQAAPHTRRGMDHFLIEGGRPLSGTVSISGAKNAVLPLMAAALLAPGRHVFRNVPRLKDVTTMASVLEVLGARCALEDHTLTVDTSGVNSVEAPYELVRTMRASVYVLGPLLARFGRARVSLPGGCAWGPRPVDLHIRGIQRLGAEVEIDHGYIAATSERLHGAKIILDVTSVGATGNILMAASLADGVTVIENAACEPEITALADYLNAMGAHVTGQGTKRIEVTGAGSLTPAEADVIPDRIEAGTFMVAGSITGSTIRLQDVNPDHLTAVTRKLEAAGTRVVADGTEMIISGPDRSEAVNVLTAPFPGFPTDMQAQIMALATTARGASVITDTIYADRFTHVAELQRLGADIHLDRNVAIVNGVRQLKAAPVMATDIRASAGLILAALCAEGETHISRIYHIDRGYEAIEAKLSALGASVRRERG